MKDIKKLYRITLKGMTYNSTGIAHGISYVIATSTDGAYAKVRDFLDTNGIGFERERELDKIELVAEDYPYTDVGCMLHLQ